MQQLKEIKFVVDEQYENEKGVFTVLSVKNNDMRIRWENGEEILTTVELQTTIQMRRQWEQLQREAKAAEAQKAKKKGKAGKLFSGFKSSDFKSSAARTNWRGRAQLGGAVTQKLAASDFKFNSWAFSTKSELHWQDADKRKQDADGNAARFFVRLETSGVHFGFLVSQKGDQSIQSTDWQRFHGWTNDKDNQNQLQTLVETHNLTMYDSSGATQNGMTASDTYFEISAKLDKDAAIAREKDICEDIATLFSAMVPLYQAAVTG